MGTAESYESYLRLDELLSLQRPCCSGQESGQTVLSEQFFIVCHQTCELWLKQILDDLTAVEQAFSTMGPASLERAVDLLRRADGLLRLLHEQLIVLERLPFEDFAAFRRFLGTASGAQSPQFHRLERMIGNAVRCGTLYTEFARGAERAGSTVEKIVEAGPAAGIEHRVVEGLLDLAHGYLRWKVGHVALTSRMLGDGPGTGGTAGVAYLIDHATLPFAELRLLRGKLHQRIAASSSVASAN
ncbi:tryptophan 2,3-dioxygenase family protein [Streptomyces sp. NPDC087512]|uniref:tryptophan 2,3-dioxygenase family protein n=1 Tax=unclassified Streptomyces TaxID=2593676 RepID=UPI00341A2C25